MDRESVRRETILLIADDKKAGIFVAEYAEYSDFLKYYNSLSFSLRAFRDN